MPKTHIVKRTFPSSPSVRLNERVDASAWRNTALLERQGYLVPLDKALAADGADADDAENALAATDAADADDADEPREEIVFEEEEIEIETVKSTKSAEKVVEEEIVFEEEEIEIETVVKKPAAKPSAKSKK